MKSKETIPLSNQLQVQLQQHVSQGISPLQQLPSSIKDNSSSVVLSMAGIGSTNTFATGAPVAGMEVTTKSISGKTQKKTVLKSTTDTKDTTNSNSFSSSNNKTGASDKCKFKFPLSTRMQDEADFKVTPEALVEAAGEGADKLLIDGKMRRGKWTKEEENYANCIIQDFQDGIIQNAEIGITLRSLLADKLLCDPMRISKKFAGKACVGKQVYNVSNEFRLGAKELNERREALEALRLVFFDKVKLQQQKSRNRKVSSSKKNKKTKLSNVLLNGSHELNTSIAVELLSKALPPSSNEKVYITNNYKVNGTNDDDLYPDKVKPHNSQSLRKQKRKSKSSSSSSSYSSKDKLSVSSKVKITSANENAQNSEKSSLSNKKSKKNNRRKNNASNIANRGNSNNNNSSNTAIKRRRVKKQKTNKMGRNILNPSESILCLQSFITEDNDLQVDMTMFHPEKEEAILGIQF